MAAPSLGGGIGCANARVQRRAYKKTEARIRGDAGLGPKCVRRTSDVWRCGQCGRCGQWVYATSETPT